MLKPPLRWCGSGSRCRSRPSRRVPTASNGPPTFRNSKPHCWRRPEWWMSDGRGSRCPVHAHDRKPHQTAKCGADELAPGTCPGAASLTYSAFRLYAASGLDGPWLVRLEADATYERNCGDRLRQRSTPAARIACRNSSNVGAAIVGGRDAKSCDSKPNSPPPTRAGPRTTSAAGPPMSTDCGATGVPVAAAPPASSPNSRRSASIEASLGAAA